MLGVGVAGGSVNNGSRCRLHLLFGKDSLDGLHRLVTEECARGNADTHAERLDLSGTFHPAPLAGADPDRVVFKNEVV